MIMCSVCKVNIAVVFIAKIVEGKQIQEGLCLSCAKKQGIQPINQLLEQTGISDDEIDGLNKQVGDLFESMDISNQNGNEPNNEEGNPFFSFINRAFSSNGNDDIDKKDEKKQKEKEKRNNNSTRVKTQDKKNIKRKKYLDTYGTNLIESAKRKKIDRVIGRNKEIDRVIQILNRRNKNNPVLLGEPGVGKTAIAEGCVE